MKCEVSNASLPDTSVQMDITNCCPVDLALGCIEKAKLSSCGRSLMCRDGIKQLQILLTDMTCGKGQSDDLTLIDELCQIISTTEGCGLTQKAAVNVLFFLRKYPDEWDQHCRRKRCPSLVCKSYYSVYIDPLLCTGCGECIKFAPADAVAGGAGMIHVIKDDSSIKTAEFFGCCPAFAIKKAGAVKPKLPINPVPAGSFETSDGARRRRRE